MIAVTKDFGEAVGEPVQATARSSVWQRGGGIGSACTLPNLRNSQIFHHRKAREIMPGSSALSCTECTENRS